jgi:hypothetical protein
MLLQNVYAPVRWQVIKGCRADLGRRCSQLAGRLRLHAVGVAALCDKVVRQAVMLAPVVEESGRNVVAQLLV